MARLDPKRAAGFSADRQEAPRGCPLCGAAMGFPPKASGEKPCLCVLCPDGRILRPFLSQAILYPVTPPFHNKAL